MEKEKGVRGGYKLNRRSWWLGYGKMSLSKKKIPVFKALDQADQKYRQAVPYNDCACT